MEAVEPAGIGDQAGTLGLKGGPDRLVPALRVRVRLGVGDALVEQPAVQLVIGAEAQPRREEPLAHQPDLVLDLTLLPAGRRRAGNWLDQVVAAHLRETTVKGA